MDGNERLAFHLEHGAYACRILRAVCRYGLVDRNGRLSLDIVFGYDSGSAVPFRGNGSADLDFGLTASCRSGIHTFRLCRTGDRHGITDRYGGLSFFLGNAADSSCVISGEHDLVRFLGDIGTRSGRIRADPGLLVSKR